MFPVMLTLLSLQHNDGTSGLTKEIMLHHPPHENELVIFNPPETNPEGYPPLPILLHEVAYLYFEGYHIARARVHAAQLQMLSGYIGNPYNHDLKWEDIVAHYGFVDPNKEITNA